LLLPPWPPVQSWRRRRRELCSDDSLFRLLLHVDLLLLRLLQTDPLVWHDNANE
jgi:hypothetical protein